MHIVGMTKLSGHMDTYMDGQMYSFTHFKVFDFDFEKQCGDKSAECGSWCCPFKEAL